MSKSTRAEFECHWKAGLGLLCAALFVLGCGESPAERIARANAPRYDLIEEDAINVVLCGTGTPIPDPNRAEACTMVFVAGKVLLFDAGFGSEERIGELKLPVDRLEHIFVTHYHDDHFGEIGHVIHRSWIFGRDRRVHLHGPKGLYSIAKSLSSLYKFDREYRVQHHGSDNLDPALDLPIPQEIAFPSPTDRVPVLEEGGLVVSAFLVAHDPVRPAVGYRIDYRGRSVVLSGDTIETESLARAARGADLLISEVINKEAVTWVAGRIERMGRARQATMARDVLDYHIGTRELGELAERAGVRKLVLTHLVPGIFQLDLVNYFLFQRPVSRAFSGEVVVGWDGAEFRIPLD